MFSTVYNWHLVFITYEPSYVVQAAHARGKIIMKLDYSSKPTEQYPQRPLIGVKYLWVSFYWHGLTWILAWVSNFIHYKVWYEITYPFLVEPLKFGMDK